MLSFDGIQILQKVLLNGSKNTKLLYIQAEQSKRKSDCCTLCIFLSLKLFTLFQVTFCKLIIVFRLQITTEGGPSWESNL